MIYTFDEYEKQVKPVKKQNNSVRNTNSVGFFSLQDGEEAVVRFMQDDRKDFPVLSLHEITVGNSLRRVNCLATRDNPNCCPLCKSNKISTTPWGTTVEAKNTTTRVYIKLLQYVPDANGNIVAVPKIWDRPVKWVRNNIISHIDNYGALSEMVCKISRTGRGTDTAYIISPNLSKKLYTDEVYVKEEHAFDGFKLMGGIILTPTADEMVEFERSGVLPQRGNVNTPTVPQNTAPYIPTVEVNAEKDIPLPWEQPSTIQRPTRMF